MRRKTVLGRRYAPDLPPICDESVAAGAAENHIGAAGAAENAARPRTAYFS